LGVGVVMRPESDSGDRSLEGVHPAGHLRSGCARTDRTSEVIDSPRRRMRGR
jgi:hypothetical protein